MSGRVECSEVVELCACDAARIRSEALRLVAEPGDSAAALAERGAALVTALPVGLARALHRYGEGGSPNNALLVRGLLADTVGLQPTPATTTPAVLEQVARIGVLSLLAVLSALGEPFTFASLYEGRLVQHVAPVPGREAAQTSEGSDSVLEWHVEDAFTEDRCDFFGLLCLRGEPGVATLVAAARRLDLPDAVERVLRQPRFVVEPDIAHGVRAGPGLPVLSALTGPAEDPEICFDAVYQRPADPGDDEAAAALAVLVSALEDVAVAHVLESGELLIADNRRVVHGRATFRPRYDGTDRWLLRAMVCASKRAHRRRGAARVLT